MHVRFQKNGVQREVKHGFSWTVFFFGWIALFVRGQIVPGVLGLLTFNITTLYYMFAANKLLARSLAADGWRPVDSVPAEWGIAV